MKRLIRNNMKVIIAVIITMILTGGITGVVAYNYSAKDIGYEPNDSTWNVNNVGDALKSLNTSYKELKTEFENSKCISGTFKCTTCNTSSGQAIPEINFNPKSIMIYNGSDWGYIHIREWDEGVIAYNIDDPKYVFTGNTNSTYIKFNNVLYLTNWSNDLVNKTYTYVACK